MAILNFNAATVDPQQSFDPIPAGWYNAMIDQSEMKPTKDGSGAYLELRYSIIDGQFINRKIFTRLNLQNANPTAQEIAYKTLSAIAHATGVIQVADSNQLHGIPHKIKVKIRPAKDDYEATNEISGYKNINEATGVEQVQGVQGGGVPAGFGNPAQGGFGGQPQQWGNPAPTTAPVQQNQQPWGNSAPVQQQQQVDPNAAGAYTQPVTQQQQVQQTQQQPWTQPATTQPWANGAPQQGQQQQQTQQQVEQPASTPISEQQVQQAQTATPPWQQGQQHQQIQGGSIPPWQQTQQ